MKWFDKLKYKLFNYHTSKYFKDHFTLFIGDINNKKYADDLFCIIDKYIHVNYNNNLYIALSFISMLNTSHIYEFIKDLNLLNKSYNTSRYTLYYKKILSYSDSNLKLGFKIEDVLDIISVDIFFLSKILDFFQPIIDKENISYKDISWYLFVFGMSNDLSIFDKVKEFLNSIGIDIDELI